MTTTSMQGVVVYLQKYRSTSFDEKGFRYFISYKYIEKLMTHVNKDNN